MIVKSTTLAGKSLVLGVSAAAHAALVLGSLGPAGSPRAAAPRPMSAEIAIEPMPEVQAFDEPLLNKAERTPSARVAPHHHTHPYPVPADHDLVPHDPSLVHASVAPSPSPDPAPGVSPVVASDAMPRFSLAVAAGSSQGAATGGSSAGGAVGTEEDAQGPLSQASVDAPARRVRGDAPAYPLDARRDEIEGDVPLLLVVSRTGSVESALVLRPAGHGLDEAAVAAARAFQFTPAVKNGRPVRVRVSWTVTFRLE